MNVHTGSCRRLVWSVPLLAAAIVWTEGQTPLALAGDDVKIEELARGLDTPAGLAVNPLSEEVYVSESGAGRVVKIAAGKVVPVISGWPVRAYAGFRTGPLGLAWFDERTLVVGEGGRGPGLDCVRVFRLSDQTKSLSLDDSLYDLGPLREDNEHPAEGGFFSLAVNAEAAFCTSHGDARGWIAGATIQGTKFGELSRRFTLSEQGGTGLGGGLTFSPRGELVVGTLGPKDAPGAADLAFYRPQDGKLLLRLPTGLSHITGLAYGPRDGQLYAIDFAWHDPSQGGLFRLESSFRGAGQAVRAVQLARLARPTSLVAAADGSLLVSILGPPADAPNSKRDGATLQGDRPAGKVLRLLKSAGPVLP